MKLEGAEAISQLQELANLLKEPILTPVSQSAKKSDELRQLQLH